MRPESGRRHTVDILFVITLFAVFALSLLAVILSGANVYENIIAGMNRNYDERTSFTYIVNKVRSGDEDGSVAIGKFADLDAIIISEEIDNVQYCTYMYFYDGTIKELFTRKGQQFDPEYGDNILECDGFDIEKLTPSYYKFTIDNDGESLSSYVHLRTTAK